MNETGVDQLSQSVLDIKIVRVTQIKKYIRNLTVCQGEIHSAQSVHRHQFVKGIQLLRHCGSS